MRNQKYEALTNAACAPDTVPCFNFRAGDTIELPQNEAEMLLKQNAIRPLNGPTRSRGGNESSGSGQQSNEGQTSNPRQQADNR